MWTLAPPDVSEADAQLTTALTFANGQPVYLLTAAERAAVSAVYQAYDALLGKPAASLTPDALTACRSYIRDSYNQVQIGGRLATLRSTILASTDTCPYCGFGEPTELDHYLPKIDYNELAIYPRNLVPSCGPCNNAKRAVVPTVGGAAGFIHPYFEELPNVAFMKADVIFAAGSLDVTFRIDATALGPALAQMLQYQLDRLKLVERYHRQVNKFLFEQRTAILMFAEMGLTPHELSLYFTKSAISLARNFGRNDWRAVLFNALAANAGFCAAPELYLG